MPKYKLAAEIKALGPDFEKIVKPVKPVIKAAPKVTKKKTT